VASLVFVPSLVVRHSDLKLKESSLAFSITRPACRIVGLRILPRRRMLSDGRSYCKNSVLVTCLDDVPDAPLNERSLTIIVVRMFFCNLVTCAVLCVFW
jgi:hypothetical protein